MSSVAGTSHALPLPTTAAPPHPHAGCKRTLAVYDPAAAAEQRADADADADAAMVSADAGALVVVPSHAAGEPIEAAPLAVAAPGDKERAEPRWIRARLLPYLRLRFDLPMHFVDEKTVTATDVDPQQNRFRLPIDGVMRNLRPVLSPLDRQAANLLHDETLRPRLPKPPKAVPVPGAGDVESKAVRKKRRGRKHGGLPVLAIEYHAGVRELQLTRWESSGVCVVKGEGYMDFISSCGFGVGDVVEIWAFKESNSLRCFGVDMCRESPLFLFFMRKGQILPLPQALALYGYGGDGDEDEAEADAAAAQDDAPCLDPAGSLPSCSCNVVP